MLILNEKVMDIVEYDRLKAIILFEDKIYENDGNHQDCLYEAFPTIFKEKKWNLSLEEDLAEAIDYTDAAFRNNEMFGFDLMTDFKGSDYMVAHYPQNLEDKKCYDIIKTYCDMNGYSLCTYLTSEKLGSKFKEVLERKE